MTLKEEREYNIIEEKLVYKADQKKWEAGYPWIKDPRTLPDNKSATFTVLKATKHKTRKEALTLTSEIDKILEHNSFRIKGWAMP